MTLGDKEIKRVNVKKILSLNELVKKPYQSVTIELEKNYDLNEIQNVLSNNGDTKIKLLINKDNYKALFSLKNNRKFDLKDLKLLKSKKYVQKITF